MAALCLTLLFFDYPFFMKKKKYNKINAIKYNTVILLFLLTAGLLYQVYMETHFSIYDTALRFHVRAASDTDTEQALKYKVRDGVLEILKDSADTAENAEDLKEEIVENMHLVAKTAITILRQNGSKNSVRVSVTKERFPARRYGNVWFPAGEYEALRVDIGQAQGHNWWCAIYPELCYNAEESMTVSKKGEEDMERDLSDEEREVLCGKRGRFQMKILEWFSEWIQ